MADAAQVTSRSLKVPSSSRNVEYEAAGDDYLHALRVLAKLFVIEALTSRVRDMIGTRA